MFKRNDIYYAEIVHDGKRYYKSLKVKNKTIAKEEEAKFRTAVVTGKWDKEQERKKKDVKFCDALEEYLEKESVNLKSHERNECSAKHLRRFFGNKTLSRILPDTVTDYKQKRKEEITKKRKGKEGGSFATVNRELALLKRLYNWYSQQKRLNLENPVKGIAYFKEIERDRIMTEAEEELFFTKGNPQPHLAKIVYLALNTGMRKGEILNLKKSDVVLGDIRGFISLRDTKNGDNRKVPLTNELTDFFKQVINDVSYSEFIFSGVNGKPLTDISGSWENTCKRAGIENLRIHDLRHTYCTRMSHEGINPFTTMQIVGHKDTKTARRYNNPTEEHVLSAMSKVTRQFSRHEQKNELTGTTERSKSKVMIGS
jgi:integrase